MDAKKKKIPLLKMNKGQLRQVIRDLKNDKLGLIVDLQDTTNQYADQLLAASVEIKAQEDKIKHLEYCNEVVVEKNKELKRQIESLNEKKAGIAYANVGQQKDLYEAEGKIGDLTVALDIWKGKYNALCQAICEKIVTDQDVSE